MSAGQPLFSMHTRALQQQLALAEAAARGAEAERAAAGLELDNTRLLLDRGVVSPAELARAEARVGAPAAAVQQARAEVELARAQLDLADLRAPFDGVLGRIPLKVGNTLAATDLFSSLSDPSEIYEWFHLSERKALAWTAEGRAGRDAEVQLVLPDGSVFAHPGRVDAASGELDPTTRTLALRARFSYPDGLLRHGGTAKVRVRTELPDALLVPQQATVDIQGDCYVYVVDAEQVPRARRIQARQRVGPHFVVSEGLSAGERFVAEGVQKVRDGEATPTRDLGAEG